MAPFAIAEVLGLLVLDTAITLKGGLAGQDLLHTFTPAGAQVTGVAPGGLLGLGLAMTLGLLAFVGFETGAAYGEEARTPKKAIPTAIFSLLVVLSLLYTWTSYAVTIGVGWQHAGDLLGNIASTPQHYLWLANRYVGSWLGDALIILVLTSNFASAFAMHQAMVRYFYAMGREGILPSIFGQTHPRWKRPSLATCAQSSFTLLVLLLLGLVIEQHDARGGSIGSSGRRRSKRKNVSGLQGIFNRSMRRAAPSPQERGHIALTPL